jgi:hypothetical protein
MERNVKFAGSISVLLPLLWVAMFWSGCKSDQKKGQSEYFDSDIQCVDSIKVLPISTQEPTIVPIQKIEESVKTSELIKEFDYIFPETTQESLFGMLRDLAIYKNHIYALDFMAENVLIFDLSGKFIRKMTKGEGPGEFLRIASMFVDKHHDQLILYDMERDKFVYCTLDGIPTGKAIDTQFFFTNNFAVAPSGDIVYETQIKGNPHLGDFYQYKLIYADSTGRAIKAAVKYDDNKEINTGYSDLINGGDAILYHPQFINRIYEITDSAEVLRYVVDMSKLSPVSIPHIQSLHSAGEMHEYMRNKSMLYDFIDTKSHCYTEIMCKQRRLYSFHNKRTGQTRSFYNLTFDSEFVVDIASIFSDGTHFIGSATPEKLKQMVESRRKEGRPVNRELEEKIDNLHEDDNSALVLFTIK